MRLLSTLPLAFSLIVLLAACTTAPGETPKPIIRPTDTALLDSHKLTELVVLAPGLPGALAMEDPEALIEPTKRVLIEKGFSVPKGLGADADSVFASGSEWIGVVAISFTEVQARSIARDIIYANGEISVSSAEGLLWKRAFENLPGIVPDRFTGSNREERVIAGLGSLVRNQLLKMKPRIER